MWSASTSTPKSRRTASSPVGAIFPPADGNAGRKATSLPGLPGRRR